MQGKTCTSNHKMKQTKGMGMWNVPHLLSFRLQRAHRQPSCRAVNFCTSDFGTFFVKSCSGATSGWYSHNFILKYCTDSTTPLYCSQSAQPEDKIQPGNFFFFICRIESSGRWYDYTIYEFKCHLLSGITRCYNFLPQVSHFTDKYIVYTNFT